LALPSSAGGEGSASASVIAINIGVKRESREALA
jgi:hypothetical protein